MLRSTGQDLEFVERYGPELPGWFAKRENDQLYVADFDGDGKDDLYVFNGSDWPSGYLGMLQSTGVAYSMVELYDGELPVWNGIGENDIGENDQFYVADFDGDGRDDLYVFNAEDYDTIQLQMLRSTGTKLESVRVYEGSVPDWGEMRKGDRWYPADFDGDGRDDLYVFNATDWGDSRFLGMLQSSGTGLSGSRQEDTIGKWELDKMDQLQVVDLNGDVDVNGDLVHSEDLLIYNDEALGLLRSFTGVMGLSRMYRGWVHNHAYHEEGWW
jgi:hypothetical protein